MNRAPSLCWARGARAERALRARVALENDRGSVACAHGPAGEPPVGFWLGWLPGGGAPRRNQLDVRVKSVCMALYSLPLFGSVRKISIVIVSSPVKRWTSRMVVIFFVSGHMPW